MSEEDAKAFLKKLSEDKELQEKLKGVDSEEKFFAVAKAAGFDFTKEEWLTVGPKLQGAETSDDDLAEASGGHYTDASAGGVPCCSFLSICSSTFS